MPVKSNSFLIFLVEDDVWFADILEYHLSLNPDYVIEKFTTAKDCLDNLHRRPDVVCLDYELPDMNGGDLLKKLQKTNPALPIILISGQNDVKIAIDFLKEDMVKDYLVKDHDTKDRLWKSILNIREHEELKEQVENLKEQLVQKYDFEDAIKGNSAAIKSVFKLMNKACDNNITVSVTGETGTGKELVAKCIHYNSPRKKKSLVAVNMSAIPKDLVESELFGHEKGAFTGAVAKRIGKFEEAHKGTLFLDEIADMDPTMQAKLLRVLQEREVTPVGSNKTKEIDVRLIVATHKDLAEEVRNGNFREDLYFRLLGLPVKMPPLRERKEDILILAKFFIDSFCKENKKKVKSLSEEAKQKLLTHAYPGNVRELKSLIELAIVLSDEQEIQASDITFNSTGSIRDFMSEDVTLKEFTNRIIQHYLEKYDNDVALVAEKLDIGKSTLYKMIKRGEV